MPKVEDVPGPVGCPAQHIMHTLLYNIPGSQQQRGVEIALNAVVETDTLPGSIKVDARGDADNMPTGLADRRDKACSAVTKVNGSGTEFPVAVYDGVLL